MHIQLNCDLVQECTNLGRPHFVLWRLQLCVHSVKPFFSCRPSGALNFDAAARIMGNLCTTDVMDDITGLSVDVWNTAGGRRLLTEEVYHIFMLIC